MNGKLAENSEPRPFENHQESATRKFNVKGFATRPAAGCEAPGFELRLLVV